MPESSSIEFERTDRVGRLRLVGRVDARRARELLAAAQALAAHGRPVELDLSASGHLDGATVQVLLILAETVRVTPPGLTVQGAPAALLDLWRGCGIDRALMGV
jgi:ABC-type transporter Mla MlaB component